ncbi:MAG: FKBP-type peptidyl-prolyl cis-trans isomerase [Bacteroidales bacterium]|nr:FKBP-type peptidyl-prolyl cis-trans isomerase [Bacteroidales bacterium]
MNRLYAILSAAAVILSVSCARTPTTGTNESNKQFFDAWVTINKTDDWKEGPLGCWLIEDEPGTGEEVGDTSQTHFVHVRYSARSLDGGLLSSTEEWAARQLDLYDPTYYFGPRVWRRGESTLYAGVDAMLEGMKEGGRRRFVMPGWLATYSRYSNVSGYLDKVTGSDSIYEITLVDAFDNLLEWESDSIWRYVHRLWPDKAKDDLVEDGMYYITTKEPTSRTAYTADSTYYINYTGRCLDGRVFDTTIRDTAMFYGIWSESRTYAPVGIKWADSADQIKFVSSSAESSDSGGLISGFTKTLWQMGRYEAGAGIFYSSLGYSAQGSGSLIPPYSPLRFDIEFTDKPE